MELKWEMGVCLWRNTFEIRKKISYYDTYVFGAFLYILYKIVDLLLHL